MIGIARRMAPHYAESYQGGELRGGERKKKQCSGCSSFQMDAIPERPQSVQCVVQNYIFFNMVCRGCEQFFDAEKNGSLRLRNPRRNLIPVALK
jgi:hypothetical protein